MDNEKNKVLKLLNSLSLDEVNAYFREKDGLCKLFNISLLEISETHSIVSMPLLPEYKNALDTAHGGSVFALADIAFGAAAIGSGYSCVTAQSSFSFLNAGRCGPIIGEARLIKNGKHLMTYTVSVYCNDKKLLAHGQFTGYKLGEITNIFGKEI